MISWGCHRSSKNNFDFFTRWFEQSRLNSRGDSFLSNYIYVASNILIHRSVFGRSPRQKEGRGRTHTGQIFWILRFYRVSFSLHFILLKKFTLGSDPGYSSDCYFDGILNLSFPFHRISPPIFTFTFHYQGEKVTFRITYILLPSKWHPCIVTACSVNDCTAQIDLHKEWEGRWLIHTYYIW